jgi:hypothetical protein
VHFHGFPRPVSGAAYQQSKNNDAGEGYQGIPSTLFLERLFHFDLNEPLPEGF